MAGTVSDDDPHPWPPGGRVGSGGARRPHSPTPWMAEANHDETGHGWPEPSAMTIRIPGRREGGSAAVGPGGRIRRRHGWRRRIMKTARRLALLSPGPSGRAIAV